jgi:hypothetical protein
MMIQIFRSRPALGQTFVADYLEREGWFDADGWRITGDWFPDDKFQNGADAVVGDGVNWSLRTFGKAHEMWQTYGRDNGLYMDDETRKNLEDQAALYRKQYEMPSNRPGGELSPGDKGTSMEESYKAHNQLYWNKHYRDVTNFPHFYFVTEVRQEPRTIETRKKFFQAEQLRKAGDREQAVEVYREAIPKWREILMAHQGFRRDHIVQEDTAETVYKYMELARDVYGRRFKELMLMGDFLAQEAFPRSASLPWLPPALFAREMVPTIAFPLDGRDDEGYPIVSHEAKYRTRTRMGLPVPPGSSPYSREDYPVPPTKN